MNIIKYIDRFLILKLYQPIILNSKLSQFTWAYISVVFYTLYLLLYTNLNYLKYEPVGIKIIMSSSVLFLGIGMSYFIHRDHKQEHYKKTNDRIIILIICSIFFIIILRLETFVYSFGLISTMYFQANMNDPFDENKKCTD